MNNDFEARLAARLARLDAAVPAPREPVPVVPPTAVGDRRFRRRTIVVLAAAALLMSASVIAVTGRGIPRTAAEMAKDAAVEARVSAEFGALLADRCIPPAEGTGLFRERLDALGLQEWTIFIPNDLRQARCVTVAAVGADRQLVVIPGVGGDVAKALDAVYADLMTRCASAEEAVALVRSTLVSLGRTDAKVEIAPAWAFPSEDGGAFVKHMADGCAVYSGSRSDARGRYTWFVSTE